MNGKRVPFSVGIAVLCVIVFLSRKERERATATAIAITIITVFFSCGNGNHNNEPVFLCILGIELKQRAKQAPVVRYREGGGEAWMDADS